MYCIFPKLRTFVDVFSVTTFQVNSVASCMRVVNEQLGVYLMAADLDLCYWPPDDCNFNIHSLSPLIWSLSTC